MANNSPNSEQLTQDDELSLATLIWRLGVSLVVLIIVIIALGLTVREPLEQFSEGFVNSFGVVGVLVATFVMDAIPFTTHEPILFFAYSGGLGFWTVFAFASAGSVGSGSLGWAMGKLVGRSAWVTRKLRRYKVTSFLNKYGVWAIAVAATTPFPFAVSTWGAGAAGVPWKPVFIGSLFRIPKVLFYLTLIALGWSVGG